MASLTTPAPVAVDPHPPVRRRVPTRRAPIWLAVVATSLPMFMATLDNLVMTSALPVIQPTSRPPSTTWPGS